jgi:predicted nuclease with TOPRIM domain
MVIQFISKKELRIRELEKKNEILETTIKTLEDRISKLETSQSLKELTPEQVKQMKEEQERTNLQMQNILSQYLYGATRENGGKPIK